MIHAGKQPYEKAHKMWFGEAQCASETLGPCSTWLSKRIV